ncbi:unnamed protein product [Spirodela intermedia]|uniref:Arginyl-tRNA--protein transferase n=1 Tax=Spirodela intermedia TaxID=51605 RepID=A0A7I8JIX3_SPIIN|nr:unnamed protein product [Spirodela intermedia]CAA6669463.1 unnamed protein product [Spirodela intermedia]
MAEGASSSNSGRVRRRGETVVLDHGQRKGSCGYCKSSGFNSISHGLSAHIMTVDDFQDLLDRGWRRSGSYLYKPEMERTCCPSYTIRLKANDFVPSKEQRRVLKKMERFLDGTLDLKMSSRLNGETNSMGSFDGDAIHESSTRMVLEPRAKGVGLTIEDDCLRLLSKKIDDAVVACFQSSDSRIIQLPQAIVKRLAHKNKRKLKEISEDMLYTSGIAFQIAATLQRYQNSNENYCQDIPVNISSQIGAHTIHMQEELSDMIVRACNGHLNFYSSGEKVNSEMVGGGVVSRTQSSKIGRGKDGCVHEHVENSSQQNRRRKLEIRMKRSNFDPEEFELYKRYQIRVHNDKPDKVTKSQYYRFLVETPVQFVSTSKHRTVPPAGLSSVLLGVVDILPRCLSSKYLFWDPDLAFLSLGKYSALKEIEWVMQSRLHCPSLQYYYLGYYIHSCSKMRYKAAYYPSELLCPLRYEWVPFTIARTLLDKNSYVVLSDHASLLDGGSSPSQLRENSRRSPLGDLDPGGHEDCSSNEDGEMEVDFDCQESESDDVSDTETGEHNALDLSDIVLELNDSRVKFKDIQHSFGPIPEKNLRSLEQQLRRYARVVGTELANTMIYRLM